MEGNSEEVRVPGLYPATVLGKARKILDATDFAVGQVVTEEVARRIMESVSVAILPRKPDTYARGSIAIHKTVVARSFGDEFTPAVQKEMALRLAGNYKVICQGVDIPEWSSNAKPEWALLYCCNYDARVGKGGRRGAFLFFDVLTGSAAGSEIRQFFTTENIERMSGRVGVKDKWDMRPFYQGEMVGMYFPALLAAGEELLVDSVADPVSAVKSANAKLSAARQDRTCDFGRKCPCARCDIGYDQCALGCHRVTYEEMECTCSETRNWASALADPAKMAHASFCCEKCPRRARTTV